MQTRAKSGRGGKVPRRWARLAALAAGIASASVGAAQTVVQTADSTWIVPASAESLEDTVLGDLGDHGYLLARIDSVAADTAFVTPGARARVQAVEVIGAAMLLGPSRDWRTRSGAPLDLPTLRADLRATALRYARLGYTNARLVPQIDVVEAGRAVTVTVRIDEGPESAVVGVELAGARGRNVAFASRRAGLSGPTSAADLDLARIQAALEATGLYTEVGEPLLATSASGELVVQVPVVEAPPGAVDVVLGYLPPAGGAPGGVVGRGRVDLRNLFGGGRTASVAIERTPGLVSSFAVDLADPYVLGSAFGLAASFVGASRDSTLARQRVGLDVSYAFDPTLELVASLAGETVRPGTFGAGEVDGRARVRRTDEVLFGVGLRLTRVDRLGNPRRGVTLGLLLEQGRRARDEFGPSARRRLRVRSRAFVPTLARQSLALGVDATVSQQNAGPDDVVDEGDLVRFGGAESFRGYDEQALLAQSYGRLLAEYRLLLDDVSFAFAFVDAGALDRPAVSGLAAQTRTLVGYGAGLRVQTALGLATVTYALNPDLSAGRGKVHVGLAVGL